jgi:hypothetical protein
MSHSLYVNIKRVLTKPFLVWFSAAIVSSALLIRLTLAHMQKQGKELTYSESL